MDLPLVRALPRFVAVLPATLAGALGIASGSSKDAAALELAAIRLEVWAHRARCAKMEVRSKDGAKTQQRGGRELFFARRFKTLSAVVATFANLLEEVRGAGVFLPIPVHVLGRGVRHRHTQTLYNSLRLNHTPRTVDRGGCWCAPPTSGGPRGA